MSMPSNNETRTHTIFFAESSNASSMNNLPTARPNLPFAVETQDFHLGLAFFAPVRA